MWCTLCCVNAVETGSKKGGGCEGLEATRRAGIYDREKRVNGDTGVRNPPIWTGKRKVTDGVPSPQEHVSSIAEEPPRVWRREVKTKNSNVAHILYPNDTSESPFKLMRCHSHKFLCNRHVQMGEHTPQIVQREGVCLLTEYFLVEWSIYAKYDNDSTCEGSCKTEWLWCGKKV